MTTTLEANINQTDLKTFTYNSMKNYTKEVIEDRAIPEIKDGLKPVQRKILWAMYKLNLMPNLAYKKSAKVSGDVMGKYHPHGDSYVAIVNMSQASKKYNLVDGQGNWGNFDGSPAASSRYTECRLSKLAEKILFDKPYLEVIPYVDNYDGTEKEPLYLPAKLPLILMLGIEGIGVGTRVGIPVFEAGPLIDCIIDYIKTGDLDTSKLVLTHLYNGKDITPKEVFEEYIKTGNGIIESFPEITKKGNKIEITGLQDNFIYDSKIERLSDCDYVRDVTDESSQHISIKFVLKDSSEATWKSVSKILKTSFVTNTGIINKLINDSGEVVNNYNEISILSAIHNWTKFRLLLEKKCLNYLIHEKVKEIKYQQLLLKAANNLQIIFSSLKAEDSNKYLVENLKVTDEEAETLLSLQIKRLNRLNADKTRETLINKKKEYDDLKDKLANVKQSVINDLLSIKKEFNF